MSRSAWMLASAVVVAWLVQPAMAQRGTRERGILVSVAGSNDAPVTDLKAADFVVRENGVAREVLSASPAPPPSHVAILVDDSQALQPNLPFLRTALAAFIRKMAALTPAPQQALMTFGERPTRRGDFTPNPDALIDASQRIFPVMGSGAYFLQAITDVCRDLRKREAPSPVIFAFVAERGPEFSTDLHTQVADALRSVGASLWVVTLQQGAQPIGASELRERAAVLGDVTTESGGMNKVVLSGQGIEAGFNVVTALITSRYLVTYGRPDALVPPDRIEVESRRRNVRVRTSRWAGR